MVNAVGLAGLAGVQVNVGFELAGQRVTLRMDGTQMTVISHDGGTAAHSALPRASHATGTGCAAPAGLPASPACAAGPVTCSGGSRSAARSWSPPSESRSA